MVTNVRLKTAQPTRQVLFWLKKTHFISLDPQFNHEKHIYKINCLLKPNSSLSHLPSPHLTKPFLFHSSKNISPLQWYCALLLLSLDITTLSFTASLNKKGTILVFEHPTMNTCQGVQVKHTFSTMALDRGEWSAVHPTHFTSRKDSLVATQSQSGRSGTNFQPLPGIQPQSSNL
jgi:hypothetical protein